MEGIERAVREAVSAVNNEGDQARVLLALASQARRGLELGLAEQLFARGLALLRQASTGFGGVSPVECDARLECARMLEEQGLHERAVFCFAGASSEGCDALLERHLALLLRLGRVADAASLVRSAGRLGPRAACEAQRLVALGILSSSVIMTTTSVPPAVVAAAALACGAMETALGTLEQKKDLLLQAAEQARRAAMLVRQGPSVVRRLANAMSSGVLRENFLQLAQQMETGKLQESLARLVGGLFAAKKLDWRITLHLAVAESSPSLLSKAARQCDPTQRWKVWVDAAQVFAGDMPTSRALLRKALAEAPEKQRVTVLLEAARREGAGATGREILLKALAEEGFWKVGLDLTLWHVANDDRTAALEAIKAAIASNPLIGRLWATLARMLESEEQQQEAVVATALKLVPRSGELWVERGRALSRAGVWANEACWSNALIFTPQFGDVFVEMQRSQLWRLLASRFGLDALRRHASTQELEETARAWDTAQIEQLCVLAGPNHGLTWDRLAAKLGGETGCIPVQVLAYAKCELLERLLAAPMDQKMRDIVFF